MLLTFDPGRHLGYCIGPVGQSDAVRTGTIKLRETTHLGPYLLSAQDPIRELLAQATAVAVETPNTAGQNHTGIRKNFALVGFVAYWTAVMGLPAVKEYQTHEIKLALTGVGNSRKEDMIAKAARALNLHPADLDEHQADAFGCWMAFSFGVPESKSQRERREAADRKAAKLAAKARALL